MLKTKKKVQSKENKLNKTKTDNKQNKIAKTLEYINESIFCIFISFIILQITPIIKDLLFFRIYIFVKLLNFIFSSKLFLKCKKIRKLFSLLMFYDNILKVGYLILLICINISYVIKIILLYFDRLNRDQVFLFYIFTSVLFIYFIITSHFILQYVQTNSLNSKNIKKYLLHSFLSKLTILNFFYLILITYILYVTRAEPNVFDYYFFFFVLYCHISYNSITFL
ncbi:hypothetical protein TUBRATIS_001980 [Tubulinosema ratisbonensis]|uniref:Uncharacterized protein n=1 Tax=Tubulinosema ratisbonensis TaxID=291195 RepID=A0A437AQ44_9MICR|nr:hypothetical protein TUBRATIS_001980 [Tubulinosema ratisbonensis]